MTKVLADGTNYSFAYNGLGDWLRQTVGGNTVNYVIDSSSGLSQVLADGTNTYLYGLDRISQSYTGGKDYFLGDALGSVRQMANTSGGIILSRNYEPYGAIYGAMGNGNTAYGFTSEWTDGIGLVNLRARNYAPANGRFTSADPWKGNQNQPISYNKWLYTNANPINYTDPLGMWICTSDGISVNPHCTEWFQSALNRMDSSGTIGKNIVKFVHSFDRFDNVFEKLNLCCDQSNCNNAALLASYNSLLKFSFSPIQGEGETIGNKIKISANYQGSVANDDGVTVLAHEISHVQQGILGWSVHAEYLTMILEYQLEVEMKSNHDSQTLIIDGYKSEGLGPNPWNKSDLMVIQRKIGYYMSPLYPIAGSLPKNWLEFWGTSIPYQYSEFIPAPTPPLTSTPIPPS